MNLLQLTYAPLIKTAIKNLDFNRSEGFYKSIRYFQNEMNRVAGGFGLLSGFNTACMEYMMISEPLDVLYKNGIPHDLSMADTLEAILYEGLRDFLERKFPQYTRNDCKDQEFTEIGRGLRTDEDSFLDNDEVGLQARVSEARKNPENWRTE